VTWALRLRADREGLLLIQQPSKQPAIVGCKWKEFIAVSSQQHRHHLVQKSGIFKVAFAMLVHMSPPSPIHPGCDPKVVRPIVLYHPTHNPAHISRHRSHFETQVSFDQATGSVQRTAHSIISTNQVNSKPSAHSTPYIHLGKTDKAGSAAMSRTRGITQPLRTGSWAASAGTV
jgi:hypothetical protein